MNINKIQCRHREKIIHVYIINYIILNQDIMNHIMLYSSIHIIKKYIQTSKTARKLLFNRHFWLNKFNHDKLPLLYYIYYNKYPNELFWIKEYLKTYSIVSNLNSILLTYDKFKLNPFTVNIEIEINENLSWLSLNFNQKIQHSYDLYATFIDEYTTCILGIELQSSQCFIFYSVYDTNDVCFIITMMIPPDQYSLYLRKMMYYLPNHEFKIT